MRSPGSTIEHLMWAEKPEGKRKSDSMETSTLSPSTTAAAFTTSGSSPDNVLIQWTG